MTVTRLGPPVPLMNAGLGYSSQLPSGGISGQVITSNGSNAVYWGENIARITANGSNSNPLVGPFVNFSAGSNIIFSWSSNSLTIAGQAGGSVGAIITSNGSNSLSPVVNLKAGVGIALGVSGQDITITNTGVPGPAGSGSASDPVFLAFGSPNTAFEFDTSSLTGLTAMGTATAEDANTTVPGALYLKRAAIGTVALTGRFANPGSAPWTAICKMSGAVFTAADFQRIGGLLVAEASPGKVEGIHIVYNSAGTGDWGATTVAYTNPTTFSAVIGTDISTKMGSVPLWYAIVATTSTSFAYYYSWDGQVWRARTTARNPGFTVGLVGVVVDPENATHGVAGAFDYLRLWTSALTIPGV